jgi:hypothetical protein
VKEHNSATETASVPISGNTHAPVIRMTDTDQDEKKMLELISGSWEENASYRIINEQGEQFLLIDEKKLNRLTQALVESQEECFKLNLEKAILQHVPIDLEDVRSVAIQEIQKRLKLSGRRKKITYEMISHIVNRIKKEHPNLFFDINSIMKAT